MNKTIIIFGSSRSNGNTANAVNLILPRLENASFIDLSEYNVTDFDYENKNSDDDFMQLVERVISHDTIILATPVYWYTMSALMKRFVDRLSDLLSTNKDQGRLFRNKNLAVISSYSVHPEGNNGFEQIFINISRYLGMNYLGCYFYYSGDNLEILEMNGALADKFINELGFLK